MNKADNNPDYKKIYDYICKEYKKTELFWQGCWDETFFSMRVYEFSKELSKKLKKKINIQALLAASLLHDIGKIIIKDAEESDNFNHYDIGEKMAKDYLKSAGHSEKFIQDVCYLIKNHANRKLKNKSIELQILQDADYLA
ncbi:MAG: HD domain-containing protein, partial [Candidatus Nanoarchaeia archaeon]|nr:HD domain-containing protein [Candidatus Nanoarchaeia archaeon]